MGDSTLVQQLEDVLRTTALSAMAVYEQGIHQTQDQLHSCLEDLQCVREAADAQCLAQVQQIQLQYQQDLDALTAQYEEQVRRLEQQTRQRINEAHAEAEEVITQAAAELLSKLQPPTPAAAAATQELSMLQLQHADQVDGLILSADQAWEEQHPEQHLQQQQQQHAFDLQHLHEPTRAHGMPAFESGNVSRTPSSIAVAATCLASSPQPQHTNAAAGNEVEQKEPQQLQVQQHTIKHQGTQQQPQQLEQLHVQQQQQQQQQQLETLEWQEQQQQLLLEDQTRIDSSYSMHHKQEQASGSGRLRRHTSSRSSSSSSRHHAAALQQELSDMPPPAHRGRASSCPGWAEQQKSVAEHAMERGTSRRHTSGHRRAVDNVQTAATPTGVSLLEHQQGWHALHNTPSQAIRSSSGLSAASKAGRSSRSSRSEAAAAGSRRSSGADAAAHSSSSHHAARAAVMAAAAVADEDDEDYTQHAAPAQVQQQHVPAVSAADVLRRSTSSRQQLSHSLVQGLRRASSEAASVSAAAAERRSDGSSGSGASAALDAAGCRDSSGHLRSTSSASKYDRHSSRTHDRGDSKGSTKLSASWQPGSASKHMDSSILKALQPSGGYNRSRHQRQDQAAAAATVRNNTWATVKSPMHAVDKGGGQQRRPSRALGLLQDDDSGSDA